MIQKNKKLRKQFRIGNNNFSLQACRWKLINFKQKTGQIQQKKQPSIVIPTCRLHTSCILLNHQIYLFSSMPWSSCSSPPHFSLINLKSCRWHRLPQAICPQPRDSHGMTLLQNQIYIFGGSNGDKYFNDLWKFNTFVNQWARVDTKGQLPHERDGMSIITYKNQGLLMFGGTNLSKNQYYQDAYVFKKFQWKQIKTVNYPQGLVGPKVIQINDKMYMFGGLNMKTGQYSSTLYLVNLNQDCLEFKQVSLQSSLSPAGRISHQILKINHQYLIVLCGHQICKKVFKDIWVFDTYQLKWTKIQPKNGPLKGIHSFSAIINQNIIYIIGGFLENRKEINDQVIIIQFANEQIFKAEICQNCVTLTERKSQDAKKYPKDLTVSAGFLHSLALEIKYPFHAISMIYQASKFFSPTYFRFSMNKTLSDFSYITIQFDGCSFGRPGFIQFISHKGTNKQLKKVSEHIKLGCLRLGKTFVLISCDKKYRYVYLMSAQSRISPHYDQAFIYYAYIQNIELQRIQTEEGVKQRYLIANCLRTHLNSDVLLNTRDKNVLLVFQNKVVMTADKDYLTELISHQTDINIWKNQKKVEFLQQRGYSILNQIQLSLRTFMTYYHMNQADQPSFYLNDSTSPIKFLQYKQVLQHFVSLKLIEKVSLPKIQGLSLTGQLFVTCSQSLIANNYGILLYESNCLINRYDIQFGNLFSQHFYKNKYKQAKTVFYQLGYLNIQGLEQGLIRNGVGNQEIFSRLAEEIHNACQSQRQQLNDQFGIQQHITNKKVKIA